MYEEAIVMYAKQVDYFWYELSTFVHKLRLMSKPSFYNYFSGGVL